jgi:hypothetical protein
MKKNLLTAVLLLTTSSVVVSCQGLIDAIIGTEDKPTTSSQQTETPSSAVIKTESGASTTANTPSEITAILDQVKSDIESKGAVGYELVITNKLETTESDNKVTLPAFSNGTKLSLKFEDGAISNSPLIITTQNAGTESKEATSELILSVPSDTSKPLDLEITLPETSVTLTGSNVYGKVVALTANSTLTIGKGIVIREFQALGGLVIMEKGSTIETYVYAPMNGDEPLIISENGVLPKKIKNASDVLVSSIQNKDGSIPSFENLRVVKGIADYAEIHFPYEASAKLGKLIISDGATAFVKDVEGPFVKPELDLLEGEGTAKLYYWSSLSLSEVKQMKNVSVSKIPSDDFETSIGLLPVEVDNCSFSSEGYIIRYDTPLASTTSSTALIKNSKFEMIYKKYDSAEIYIPAQTESITSFTLTFENCEFNKDFTLYPRQVTRIHTADGDILATFHDYVARIVLKNCKYNGYEITKDNINSDQIKEFFKGSPHHLYKEGRTFYYNINGTDYTIEAIDDGNGNEYHVLQEKE